MGAAALPQATRRLIDFLGELGARWGLPAEACRVHGYLYLVARAASETELAGRLKLDQPTLKAAIAWLNDYRLIAPAKRGSWHTDSDPWELVMQALEERRRRELGPALETLRECRTAALADKSEPQVQSQIAKLVALVEDLAAIDMQARRLSSTALRRMVRLGGSAARLMDRTFGQGKAHNE